MQNEDHITQARDFANMAASSLSMAIRYGENKQYAAEKIALAQRALDAATVELNK
jgi:hypothetical protein